MGQSRRQQAEVRREQLLNTALELFAKQGFEATSTQQIATAAGVTQGLVFHYFGSKEGLLTAVLSSRHSFATSMADLLDEAESSQSPVETILHTLCAGWLSTLRQETQVSLLLAGLALTNDGFGSQLATTITTMQRKLAALLEQRRAAGEIKEKVNLNVAAHDILTPIIVFFLLHHESADWENESTQFIEDHCALWRRALTSEETSRPN